jgi:hypothetical protein
MRTGIQGITLDILLCHDGERLWMPNYVFYGATPSSTAKDGQLPLQAVSYYSQVY